MSSQSPLKQVDANLRAIQAFEGASTLPSLPSEVTLDIAGNTNMTPDGVKHLFMALEADIDQVNRTRPVEVRQPDIWTPLGSEYSPGEETGRLIYGLTGSGRVEQYSGSAVQDWKQRAVDMGFLDLTPQQVEDPRWLPEYSSVASEMLRKQASDEFAGDKPGSLSVDNVMRLVEEWLSPRGLYQAALELDLFWDINAIGRESENWGDKWRAWADEPWNPGRLLDAVTGPIDDVVFPVINWGLMLTGVSEAYIGVRAGLFGAKTVAGLHRGSKGLAYAARLGKVGDNFLVPASRLDDAAHFQNASFMSTLLGKRQGGPTGAISAGLDAFRSRPTVSKAHQSMQRWRELGGVVAAKKVNQQALRLGISSNVQALVDEERGVSIASQTGIDEAVARVMSNPVAEWSIDLLIYPPNIFERGAFANAFRAAGSVAAKTGGWQSLTDNEHLTLSWHNAYMRHLDDAAQADGATEGARAAAAAYREAVAEKGVIGALADSLAQGDKEKLGEAMGFTTVMAVIDASARNNGNHLLTAAEAAMTGKERKLYNRSRGALIGQLRHYDPNQPEVAIDGLARYGLNTGGETMMAKSSAPADVQYARAQIRARYLDDAVGDLTAGPVAGDVRLYGSMDEEGIVRWASDYTMVDDPYFVDVNLAEFGTTADDVVANAGKYGEQVSGRYKTAAMRQARLSEANDIGRFSQDKLRMLREQIGRHNSNRQRLFSEMLANASDELVTQYVYETLPSFGRFHDFVDAEELVRSSWALGQLDDVPLRGVLSPSGRRMNVNPALEDPQFPRDKWSREMYQLVNQMVDDPEMHKRLMESIMAPLMREMDPSMTRWTVAAADTPTKQEALEFAAEVNLHLKKARKIRDIIDGNPRMAQAITNAMRRVRAGSQGQLLDSSSQMAKDIAAAVAAEIRISPRAETELRMILRSLTDADMSLDDLARSLSKRTGELLEDSRWATFSVPEQVGRTAESLEDAAKQRLDDLYRQSTYIASEVDTDAIELGARLKERGYKLVYGVEFAAPQDVMEIIPQFAELRAKQLRSSGLRNWFGRKEPEHVRAVKNRIIRSTLRAEMKRAAAKGRDIGIDLEDPATLRRTVEDLYQLLHQVQDDARATLDTVQHAGVLRKVATRASLARIPFDLSRLPSDIPYRQFIDEIQKLGYTVDEANTFHRALMRTQSLGFNEQGLFAVESFLRSRNNAVDGLRLLGRHESKGTYISGKAYGAGALVGGITGAALVSKEDGRDDGFMNNLVEGAVGAAVGAAGVRAVGRTTGALAGKAGWTAARADRMETSNFTKWGYLADNLANMRDMFRFSLSPIFDASRYSEAIILNQIGDLPDGIRNLRMNQSPTGVRKAIARAKRAEGLTDLQARQAATSAWEENRRIFAATAAGDLEMETIDSVGRRFSSIGILGFSPTDWMESTFYHLRNAGVDNRKAYETVREIYTYGVTGRSSAELSMNFVFFPFSFTKKVLGHMQSFFAQDLGRLVLIQDGLASYQALNENYDLSNEFRDRLPVLDRMNRLNVLAYGIGPGRFGGVNAPIIGAARDVPILGQTYVLPELDEITNLFVPQMVTLQTDQDASELWDMTRQLLPAINDINTLIGDAIEQGHVIGSESHLTTRAQARRGWEEWRDYQESVKPALQAAGLTWASAMRRPEFSQVVNAKKADISSAYPAWKHAIGDGIARAEAIDMEILERLENPAAPEDFQLAQFQDSFNGLSDALSSQGFSMRNPEEVPPEVFTLMRKLAIELAEQEPRFKRLYDRFYRRMFGDISTELI